MMGVDNTLLKSGECQDEQASASCMLIPLVLSAHMPPPTTPGFQLCLYFPSFPHIAPEGVSQSMYS